MLDAVEVSGLRPISLINDGTAGMCILCRIHVCLSELMPICLVAINYALTRTFQTPETHIIYDAGAGAIRTTVVTFSSGPSSDSSKSSTKSKSNTTTIEAKSIGYSRGTGGNELDRRLREILIEDFNAKHNKDIRKDLRGMAKLWKEAGRVKGVLSANADAATTVRFAGSFLHFVC